MWWGYSGGWIEDNDTSKASQEDGCYGCGLVLLTDPGTARLSVGRTSVVSPACDEAWQTAQQPSVPVLHHVRPVLALTRAQLCPSDPSGQYHALLTADRACVVREDFPLFRLEVLLRPGGQRADDLGLVLRSRGESANKHQAVPAGPACVKSTQLSHAILPVGRRTIGKRYVMSEAPIKFLGL